LGKSQPSHKEIKEKERKLFKGGGDFKIIRKTERKGKEINH